MINMKIKIPFLLIFFIKKIKIINLFFIILNLLNIKMIIDSNSDNINNPTTDKT